MLLAALGIAGVMTTVSVAAPPSDKGDKIVTGGDLAFMNDAGPGGVAEVELGRLAVERGASAEIKQFAQQMINDHSKAGEKLKKLAQQKKVTLPPQIMPKRSRPRSGWRSSMAQISIASM